MDFTKDILHTLQLFAAALVSFRQEILQNVAEFFEPDSKTMPGCSASNFFGPLVKIHRLVQFNKRQALENYALGRKEFGLGRKLSRPFFPIFAIELRESFLRYLLLMLFRLVEDFQQASANGVFRPAQFLHPLLRDLGISELAQCLK